MATNQTGISEQAWFTSCPLGLVALDEQGVVCGVNPAFETMTGLTAEQLLAQPRETLPATAHRLLLDSRDPVHLQDSGVGRWLQRERQVLEEEGVTLLYFQDVTELQQLRQKNERLARQMEELAITDPLTGLANRRALTRMLDAQVTRSRRYQNPLSLALVEIVPQDSENLSDELILAVSNYLRDRLRWADVLGRWDEGRFMLMLPETSEEAASTLIENIRSGVVDMVSESGRQVPEFYLRCGLVAWGKGLDTVRLTRQVEHALDAAEASMAS